MTATPETTGQAVDPVADPAAGAAALVMVARPGSRVALAAGWPAIGVAQRLSGWGVEVDSHCAASSTSTADRWYGLVDSRLAWGRWSQAGRPERCPDSLAIVQRWAVFPGARRPAYLIPWQNPHVPAELERAVVTAQFAPLNRPGWQGKLKALLAGLAARGRGRWMAPAMLYEALPRGAGRRGREGNSPNGSEPSDPAGVSFTEELATAVLGVPATPILWMVRLTHSVVVPCWVPQTQRLVFLKLPLSPRGSAALNAHRAFVEWIRDTWPGADALPVPRVMASGSYRTQPYLIESALDGMGGGRIRAPLDQLLPGATDALGNLQAPCRCDPSQAQQLWNQRLNGLTEHPWCAAREGFDRLGQAARRQLDLLRWATIAHNDFHLGNVVYDRQLRVSGVLDWDLADRVGAPALDLIHLLVSVALRRRRRPDKADVIRQLGKGQFPAEAQAWERYARHLSLADNLNRWLPLYLVSQLWRLTLQAEYETPDSPAARQMADQAARLIRLGAELAG